MHFSLLPFHLHQHPLSVFITPNLALEASIPFPLFLEQRLFFVHQKTPYLRHEPLLIIQTHRLCNRYFRIVFSGNNGGSCSLLLLRPKPRLQRQHPSAPVVLSTHTNISGLLPESRTNVVCSPVRFFFSHPPPSFLLPVPKDKAKSGDFCTIFQIQETERQ